MRKLGENELAVQVWAERDPTAILLIPIVSSISETIDQHPKLGQRVGEVEGPTTHLPDFFSPGIFGRIHGFLIYVRDTSDLFLLKETLAKHEFDYAGNRLADIDVLLNEYQKVSAKNGQIQVVNIRQY